MAIKGWWMDRFFNSKNNCCLMLLLTDFFVIKSKNMGKDIYVTKENQCYQSTVEVPNEAVEAPDLKLNHREADPRMALHTVFASLTNESSAVCVVADDMDVYILLLLFVSVLLWRSVLSTMYWFIQSWNHLPWCKIISKLFGRSSVENNASFPCLDMKWLNCSILWSV